MSKEGVQYVRGVGHLELNIPAYRVSQKTSLSTIWNEQPLRIFFGVRGAN
jgi:hypothetical protein